MTEAADQPSAASILLQRLGDGTEWNGMERLHGMLSPLSATAYTCLTVALFVTEPSHVHLTVQDHVRVDRITDTTAERHGELLQPGTTSVYLPEGSYVFRTTQDAQLRLDDGAAVRVVASTAQDKDPWPEMGVATKGDGSPDRVPTLTVLR